MFYEIIRFEAKKVLSAKVIWICVILAMIATASISVIDLTTSRAFWVRSDNPDGMDTIRASGYELMVQEREYTRSFNNRPVDSVLFLELLTDYESRTEKGVLLRNFNETTPFWWINNIAIPEMVHTLEESPYGKSLGDFITSELFYEMQKEQCEIEMASQELTSEELSYWNGKQEKTSLPYTMQYAGGWKNFIEKSHFYIVFSTMIILIGLCGIFSKEHRYKTDALILSSKHGRKAAFAARFLAGECFALLAGLVVFGLGLAISLLIYGSDGFEAQIQLIKYETVYPLSAGGFVFTLFGIGLFACMMIAAFVMLLSESTRSAVAAVAIPFVVMLSGILGIVRVGGRAMQQIISYQPISRIGSNTLSDYRLVSLGGLLLDCIQFSYIAYGFLAVLFAVVCWIFYRNYQVNGR